MRALKRCAREHDRRATVTPEPGAPRHLMAMLAITRLRVTKMLRQQLPHAHRRVQISANSVAYPGRTRGTRGSRGRTAPAGDARAVCRCSATGTPTTRRSPVAMVVDGQRDSRTWPDPWFRGCPCQNGTAAVDRYGLCRALTLIPLFAAGEVVRVPSSSRTASASKKAPAKKAPAAKTAAAKTADKAPAGRRPRPAAAKKAPAKKTAKAAATGPPRPRSGSGPTARRSSPTCPDEQFEKDVATDPTHQGGREGGAASSSPTADDADEPEQQVMVAGATADPVKDYLKQIGKVAAAQRRAGGRARQADRGRPVRRGEARHAATRSTPKLQARARVDRRGRPAAPRTTCSRPTCASSSRWPSATPAAACSSST